MGKDWDMNWNLWPSESVTMYFEMRGRVDMASFGYNTKEFSEPRDYASAVFSFKPVFTNDLYQKFAAEHVNVTPTAHGLVPTDPAKPSHVVFGINKHPWLFCGADIKARFKTVGKVYIASGTDFNATNYSPALSWQLLSESRKEYGSASIEG